MADLNYAVLVVDDERDQVETLGALLGVDGAAEVRAPDEVSTADLESADLMLVDYRLDSWLVGMETQPTFLPANGVALASALRSRSRLTARTRPLAVAIHTGHIGDLGEEIPREIREHALARGLDLEWVFPKVGRPVEELVIAISSLARAVARLPEIWTEAASETEAKALLGLGDQSWLERAWRDVQECRAPIHELAAGSHGLSFVRWLLHRILPYPCFLLDDMQLAARLRVDPDSLQGALAVRQGAFTEASYEGILAEFLGRRWWRAGIESVLFTSTDGMSDDPVIVQNFASSTLGTPLVAVGVANPVEVIGEDFARGKSLVPADDCVRLQPDDWPPYADQAWGLKTAVRESELLRAITLEQDLYLL